MALLAGVLLVGLWAPAQALISHSAEHLGPRLEESWIANVSFMLEIEGVESPATKTGIVTFAGKRNVEYIDGAVMLGMSVQKHAPGYPMIALIITDMKEKYQELLRKAGWTLVVVPNWDRDYCGQNCDMEFLGRWHDSFEKINTFRLPFQRVLFLDSDTYIFNGRIQELLTQTTVPDGHIAMARDGCKDEFNSGVMLFQPRLSTFVDMLHLVGKRSREQILDQSLINEVYRSKVVEVPREFNCVDTIGIQPGLTTACTKHCAANVVVAHFTGHPKPTSAKRRLLELVRRPGSPAIACTNTNFGMCQKWSDFYCDVRSHKEHLSKDLRYWLHSTGDCCHSPFDPKLDKESCKECPAMLKVHGKPSSEFQAMSMVQGTYVKTNIKSRKYNGGKPIYLMQNSTPKVYMYYIQKQVVWLFGYDYSTNLGLAYAGKEAQCPRDAGAWHFQNSTFHWNMQPLSVKSVPNHNAPNDTEHIVWNIHHNRWDREELGMQKLDDDDSDAKDDQN